MKIIALITAAYLPGTFVAVRLNDSNALPLTDTPVIDALQHGNVRLGEVHNHGVVLYLLGGDSTIDDCHNRWMGLVVED